jgi:hypothetical protein
MRIAHWQRALNGRVTLLLTKLPCFILPFHLNQYDPIYHARGRLSAVELVRLVPLAIFQPLVFIFV